MNEEQKDEWSAKSLSSEMIPNMILGQALYDLLDSFKQRLFDHREDWFRLAPKYDAEGRVVELSVTQVAPRPALIHLKHETEPMLRLEETHPRPVYNSIGTRTGRIDSSKPNRSNVPNHLQHLSDDEILAEGQEIEKMVQADLVARMKDVAVEEDAQLVEYSAALRAGKLDLYSMKYQPQNGDVFSEEALAKFGESLRPVTGPDGTPVLLEPDYVDGKIVALSIVQPGPNHTAVPPTCTVHTEDDGA